MSKKLSPKQRTLIEQLFANSMTESQALSKLNISNKLYRSWLKDSLFQQEIQHQMESALREGKMLIVRHCSFAAAKLISLADSEKEETARKACLDIIETANACLNTNQKQNNKSQTEENDIPQISNEQASQMLEILSKK